MLKGLENQDSELSQQLARELAETVEGLQVACEELIVQHQELESAYVCSGSEVARQVERVN